MKKQIAVVTDDLILYNKIRLLLRHGADVTRIDTPAEADGYFLVFADMRCDVPVGARTVLIGEGGDLPLHFFYEDLIEIFERADGESEEGLVLGKDMRHVYLLGREIKLTELEYKLLEYLYAKDDFASREELCERIWNGEHDEGVVTVYVHYLRQKLEEGGIKLIISSRKYGYKLDERYKVRK